MYAHGYTRGLNISPQAQHGKQIKGKKFLEPEGFVIQLLTISPRKDQ